MQSVTSTIATSATSDTNKKGTDSIDLENTIKVAVRIRRFLPSEAGEKCIHILTTPSHPSPIVQIGTGSSSVASFSTGTSISGMSYASNASTMGGKSFFFDQAYSSDAKQKHIFEKSVRPLVEACLKGYNATVLAYGQTGSGKTYTILGPSAESFVAEEVHNHVGANGSNGDINVNNHGSYTGNHAGVIPRALKDLFNRLEAKRKQYQLSHNVDLVQKKRGEKPYDFEVRVQFLELYGEEIRDLLSNSSTKLVIRDGGTGFEPEIIGASEVNVNSAEEALLCLTRGTLRRVTGATAMNSESSRSHAIMTIIVEQTTAIASNRSASGEEGETEVECTRSKFHFVDLAGSERQKKSLSSGQRLREGIEINKGLLVLGNVISALGDPKKRGKSFVPYRDSKLTRLLKGSLGGNHKTLMIACVSPSSINLEESLNCLRYANRARNIQNNAVINLDAGSRLVAELREQLKALAGELLIFQEPVGDSSSRVFKISELKALSKGGDSSNINLQGRLASNEVAESRHDESDCENCQAVKDFKAQVAKLKSVTRQLQSDLAARDEELFSAKAEIEYYRLGGDAGGNDGSEAGAKDTFISRVEKYEREISDLKAQLRNESSGKELPKIKTSSNADAAASAKKQKKVKRSRSKQTKAPGVEGGEDDMKIKKITKKYVKVGKQNGAFVEDDDESDSDNDADGGREEDEDEDETFSSRQSILDSHLIQLSNGIAAKVELIEKLEHSQKKYDKMKSFYQDKLKKMTMQLSVQEAEKANLEQDLKNNTDNVKIYKELQAKLEKKQKHIEQLKKRQSEIKNLTSVASRNQTVIASLTKEVVIMKKQRDELRQQLLQERKDHAHSIQKLQKKAIAQQQGATKIRQQLAITTAQKERAQNIAKARAEKITELRSKYKGAEKKLRMQTLKRGMMERAGIDPVLVGRQEKQQVTTDQSASKYRSNEKISHSSEDVNKLRSILDEKVSEISRKEAAADKLACEWEDHLQLTSRKEQIAQEAKTHPNDSQLTDELEALDFQIKYKESRIRQLANRLGNKRAQQDSLMDDKKFKVMVSKLPSLTASQLTSKVLFGMVVRERRRVAVLARAACALDQKAVEAERLAASKENALRTLIDESKNERIELAQNHQEKIISLMEIVQGEGKEEDIDGNVTSSQQSPAPESIVLHLANQRIEILESQISELHQEKHTRENYQAREAETVAELTELTKEYGSLVTKSKHLRASLVNIRGEANAFDENRDPSILNNIISIVNKTLQSVNDLGMDDTSSPLEKALSSDPYESDVDQEQGVAVPDWAGHIMKDLAIIAAGEVPASLRTPSNKHLPPTPGANIFDRLSSPVNFTASHYERMSDSNSVSSNTGSQRTPRGRARSRSMTRYSTPTRSTASTSRRSDSQSRAYRSRTQRSSSPLRQKSPNHPKHRMTERVSAILKDGPPKIVKLPDTSDDDDHSLHSYRSLGSHSHRSGRSSNFVDAYTKKDVFERLQKKQTVSRVLNAQAQHSQDSSNS